MPEISSAVITIFRLSALSCGALGGCIFRMTAFFPSTMRAVPSVNSAQGLVISRIRRASIIGLPCFNWPRGLITRVTVMSPILRPYSSKGVGTPERFDMDNLGAAVSSADLRPKAISRAKQRKWRVVFMVIFFGKWRCCLAAKADSLWDVCKVRSR